ncbi:MAG: chromate transporter, partial [Oscillospiraceae bacterium]|nr:chromate transporter [Oscillospiraceae bacterium]
WVSYAFAGIRAGVIALILGAAVKLSKYTKRNALNISLLVIAFVLSALFGINAILLILGGLVFGLIWFGLLKKNEKEAAK